MKYFFLLFFLMSSVCIGSGGTWINLPINGGQYPLPNPSPSGEFVESTGTGYILSSSLPGGPYLPLLGGTMTSSSIIQWSGGGNIESDGTSGLLFNSHQFEMLGNGNLNISGSTAAAGFVVNYIGSIINADGSLNYPSLGQLTDSNSSLYSGNGNILVDPNGNIFYQNGSSQYLADENGNIYYSNGSLLGDNGGQLYWGDSANIGPVGYVLTSSGSISSPFTFSSPAPAAIPPPSPTQLTSTGSIVGYMFTVSSLAANVNSGCIYTNNGHSFTVIKTVTSSATQIWMSGTSAPSAGAQTLTYSSGGTSVTPCNDASTPYHANISSSTNVAYANYSVPSGVIWLESWITGGGAGGGGSANTANTAGGGGGGASATCYLMLPSPASTIPYIIGTNGTGSAASNGTAGTLSAFGANAAIANGAAFGSEGTGITTPGAPGLGGTVSGCSNGGVTGSSGSPGVFGISAVVAGEGGKGGDSSMGGGGSTSGAGAASVAATGYGAGGSGSGATNGAGGAGTGGQIVIVPHYQ